MKKKVGLHKKISSIFDGVPVPKSVQDHQQDLAVKEPEPVEENLYVQNEEPQTSPPVVQSPSPPPPPSEQSLPKPPPSSSEQSLPKPPPSPSEQSLPKPPPSPSEQSLPKPSPSSPLERSLPKPPPPSRPSPQPRSNAASRPEPVDKPKEVPATVRKVSAGSSPASLQMGKIIYLIKEKVYGDGDIEIDSKQKAMTVLVGIFTIVLVVILVNVLKPPKRVESDSSVDKQASTQSGNARIEWVMPEKINLKRNPMEFGGVSRVTQQGEIVISGIVDGDHPMAIVSGGKILEVGDKINGLTVRIITSEFVEFETADGERVVRQVGE